jgi:hypothetical protein
MKSWIGHGEWTWFKSISVVQVVQYIELSGQSLLLLDWFESRKVGGTVRNIELSSLFLA